MTAPRRFLLPSLLLWFAAGDLPARAEPPSDGAKRGFLFPIFKKRDRDRDGSALPDGEGPDPDATAAEPPPAPPELVDAPAEGIWDWVDRMEGEIPSPGQVAAVVEVTAEQRAERAITDELTGGEVQLRFYEDPVAALAVDPQALDRIDPAEFDIPIELNESVDKWIRYFTGNGRKYYERWLVRSVKYQPMMRAELAKAGLPQDLVYLSMIESGYNPHAYSHADAAGLWQFIESTGRVYDLRIDWWVDDRRDPEASLKAAITFLGELHRMFGDWRLAWASYNGGPGRVRGAIRKSGTKDFWKIAEGSYLHPETENYVPKIMAAAIIGKHPERYGFTVPPAEEGLRYDVVDVSGSVALEVLARCAGTTVEDLKALNPGLRRYATPPEGYPLRVPVGRHDPFVVALQAVPPAERGAVQRHTVRRGETLSIIAARYSTTVDELSHANQLRNVNRIVVGMNLVVPPGAGAPPARTVLADARPSSPSPSAASEQPPPKPSASATRNRAPEPAVMAAAMSLRPSPGAAGGGDSGTAAGSPRATETATHVVERGETLSILASRYGTDVATLKSTNGLRTSTILVGQKLKVPDSGEPAGTAGAEPLIHVVQKGEWLTAIAARYDVTPAEIQRWNGVRDPSHIEAGQKLEIRPGPQARDVWVEVVVQRGESLSKLAARHGCTVAQLQQWNELGGRSVIHPGQKLKVRPGSS
jgi:membrane-bound lytic murein transglycosylase D